MKIWAFAEHSGTKIEIKDPINYNFIKETNNLNIIISRLDCEIKILTIPLVAESEINNIIAFKLRSIYPGLPEETNFDYRAIKTDKNYHIVLFIMNKKVFDKYKIETAKYFLPYNLIYSYLNLKKQIFLFLNNNYLEISVYNQKLLLESRVHKINARTNINSLLKDTIKNNEYENLTIFSDKSQDITKDLDLTKTSFISITDLLSKNKKNQDSLFDDNKKKVIKPKKYYLFPLILCLLFGVILYGKYIKHRKEYLEYIKSELTKQQKINHSSILLQSEIKDIENRINILKENKGTNTYLFLSELKKVLGTETRILTLNLKNNEFKLEAIGPNAFKIMDRFKKYPKFSEIEPGEVIKNIEANKDKFSLSGEFHD